MQRGKQVCTLLQRSWAACRAQVRVTPSPAELATLQSPNSATAATATAMAASELPHMLRGSIAPTAMSSRSHFTVAGPSVSATGPVTHATTVVCVRKGNRVVIVGDGQVTLGSQIMKPNVRKVRRLGSDKNVIAGFAGAAADGFTLFERLESRIDEYPGQLTRAAVDLAKAWRTDKFLRRLDAVMVVADGKVSLMISGTGDVLEPHDGVLGIGSGGPYALAAARALVDVPGWDAERIAMKAMQIAADSCIYTNHNFTMEQIVFGEEANSESADPGSSEQQQQQQQQESAQASQQ